MSEPTDNYLRILKPEKLSKWRCYLFGMTSNGLVWQPKEGDEPNRFWRWMQWLCFGNRWVKDNQEDAQRGL